MGWTKKIAHEHIFIFSFMTAFIAIGLLYICNFWIFKSDNGLNYDLNRVFAYLVPLIFVLIACLFSGHMSKLEFRKKGIVRGILFGWPFIAVGVFEFVSSFVSFDRSSISFPSMQKTILFTMVMIFIGIFEEVLCRGIILNSMLNKWGYTKTGIIKAVILSSLIFGVGHIVNLVVAPTLIIRTVSQIIRTSIHGILFASIYIRCKNIWALIIIHAVYDWLVLVSGIYHPIVVSMAPVDASAASLLMSVLFSIPFALVGFFLLRKILIEDMSQSAIDISSINIIES